MKTKIDGPKVKPGEAYVGANRYISAKKARTVAAVMAGAGMLLGGLGIGASYRMAEREAAQSPLEMTCQELSEKDTSMRGLDGTVYMLKCDAQGNPVLDKQEGGN